MFVTVSVITFTEIARNVPFLWWTDTLSTVAGTWNHKDYYSQSKSTVIFRLENNIPRHACTHAHTHAQNCYLRSYCIKENNQAKSFLNKRILSKSPWVWQNVPPNAFILLFHLIRTHTLKLSFGFWDLQSGPVFRETVFFYVFFFFFLSFLTRKSSNCPWPTVTEGNKIIPRRKWPSTSNALRDVPTKDPKSTI